MYFNNTKRKVKSDLEQPVYLKLTTSLMKTKILKTLRAVFCVQYTKVLQVTIHIEKLSQNAVHQIYKHAQLSSQSQKKLKLMKT